MDLNGKRVLITGGAGHIGANLVRRLISLDVDLLVADNLWRGTLQNLMDDGKPVLSLEDNFRNVDLTDYDSCKDACRDADFVIHLADVVGGIDFVFSSEPFVFRQNILINSNVLAAAHENGCKGFLYVGAACSYPKTRQNLPDAPVLREEDIYPAEPESAYGWSKLMGEYETELYGRHNGMKTCILRLHNVYGPYSDLSPGRAQVIPSLIRKAIRYPTERFIVWGNGKQTRDFVYVEDVVRAILLGLEKGIGKGPIQIGTDRRHTIREVAEIVVKTSGKPIRIEFDPDKPVGDLGRAADWSKARNVLGWRPEIPLEEGIRRTYGWANGVIAAG